MDTDCVTYTVRQVSKLLGVSVSTLYREIRRGTLGHVKMGHRVVIPKLAVERLLGSAHVK